MKISIIYCTHPDKDQLELLSEQLIKEKLVACANIHSSTSLYFWDNALNKESEYVVLYKTSLRGVKAAIEKIKRLHPYEVPCILTYEVNATNEYGKWVEEVVQG